MSSPFLYLYYKASRCWPGLAMLGLMALFFSGGPETHERDANGFPSTQWTGSGELHIDGLGSLKGQDTQSVRIPPLYEGVV